MIWKNCWGGKGFSRRGHLGANDPPFGRQKKEKSPLTFKRNPVRIILFELFLSFKLLLPYIRPGRCYTFSPTPHNLPVPPTVVKFLGETRPWTSRDCLRLRRSRLPALQLASSQKILVTSMVLTYLYRQSANEQITV